MTSRHVVHVVCGNAGVGKSTYGAALAAREKAALLDIDTCSERLARIALAGHGLDPDDRDSPAYKQLLREPIYETLFDLARENLVHVPCVLVGPFTRERRQPGWPEELARRLAAPISIHYVHCSETVRLQRIRTRNNPRDQGKLDDWSSYSAVGRDPEVLPYAVIDVDTDPTPTAD